MKCGRKNPAGVHSVSGIVKRSCHSRYTRRASRQPTRFARAKRLHVVRLLAEQHPVNRLDPSSRQIKFGDGFTRLLQVTFILSPKMGVIPSIVRGLEKRVFEIVIAMAIEFDRAFLAVAVTIHGREAGIADQIFGTFEISDV